MPPHQRDERVDRLGGVCARCFSDRLNDFRASGGIARLPFAEAGSRPMLRHTLPAFCLFSYIFGWLPEQPVNRRSKDNNSIRAVDTSDTIDSRVADALVGGKTDCLPFCHLCHKCRASWTILRD